ncbi:MAG TPA: response regulator [Planctomycetaceae bacterium]|nr:response regulator [Planctomycetaceae bacterium]
MGTVAEAIVSCAPMTGEVSIMTQKASILVADDDDMFRESICRFLSRAGYHLDDAPDADRALAKLQQQRFDVVIADIHMPGNSQLQLVREVQRHASGISLILVTGYPSLDTAVSAVGGPVSAYLVKPVNFSELLEHVRRCVAQSALRRRLSRVKEQLRRCVDDLHFSEASGAEPLNRGEPTWVPSNLTVRSLAACLSELLQIRAQLLRKDRATNLCELVECPQRPKHRLAIQETIEVLKKTKSTFKSKQLADLRTKLEGLFSNHRPPCA